jgi:ABC-type antimicrobial peptide transport system permease subunit
MRGVIAEWGGNAPTDVTTGTEYRDRVLVREPLLAKLLSFFGLFALVISCLGIYGLLASVVSGRTTEVGIRMALGARRRFVVWLVVKECLIPVSGGMIIGILAAIPLTRAIESILFGVPKHDPVTILVSVFIFLIVSGAAAFIPARRAARLDPMRALRYE